LDLDSSPLPLIKFILILLLVYLGWQTLQQIRDVRAEPEVSTSTASVSNSEILGTMVTVRHLKDYRIIWERNLFNVSKNSAPGPNKETKPDKIALAQKDIGLRLVGTVVGDNPDLNFAFIDNRRTLEQTAYQEGEKAGDVVIKKVLRNKVIIATADGDRILTIDVENTLQAANSGSPTQERVSTAAFRTQSTVGRRNTARSRFIQLDREDIEGSLADTDRILREVKISPYMFAGRPYGFRISNIGKDSVLSRMGLRSGVVITELNGQTITSPDQAAMFFQALQEGGTIDFKYRRRLRTIRVNLDIG